MGICLSRIKKMHEETGARATSNAIDKELQMHFQNVRNQQKVLLLGPGESGKTTILKQMKIIHQNGFGDEELLTYRPTIYCNTLDSAQAIVLATRKIGLNFVDPNNHMNANRIINYRINSSPSFEFSPEIARAIHELCGDPIIPKLMDHRAEFYLMDNAAYFFKDVLRIGRPNYLPTENDVLHARLKTTGITETIFTMGPLQIHMFDVGGQRSERKKWIHCFESVTSIVFCTALSEYDQVLLEEKNRNRMAESLDLFESVVNSRWFVRTSIILFLNKTDVFRAKLLKIPLERYFPEYSGGADINKAAKYILWKFIQTNHARLSIYPHLVQATDTANIHLVFPAVKDTILRNALKDTGIL